MELIFALELFAIPLVLAVYCVVFWESACPKWDYKSSSLKPHKAKDDELLWRFAKIPKNTIKKFTLVLMPEKEGYSEIAVTLSSDRGSFTYIACINIAGPPTLMVINAQRR